MKWRAFCEYNGILYQLCPKNMLLILLLSLVSAIIKRASIMYSADTNVKKRV